MFSEQIDFPSVLQELCEVLSISYPCGVVYHIGDRQMEISPGGARLLSVASSITSKLLKDGRYVPVEILEEMMNKNQRLVGDWREKGLENQNEIIEFWL